jgi:hypothetical protein
MSACYHPCVLSTSFYVVGFTIITTRPRTITYHDTFFSRCAPGLNRVHYEQRQAFEVGDHRSVLRGQETEEDRDLQHPYT